jgi:hypothetical protein
MTTFVQLIVEKFTPPLWESRSATRGDNRGVARVIGRTPSSQRAEKSRLDEPAKTLNVYGVLISAIFV